MVYFWQIIANFSLNFPNLPFFFPKFHKFAIFLTPPRSRKIYFYSPACLACLSEVIEVKESSLEMDVPIDLEEKKVDVPVVSAVGDKVPSLKGTTRTPIIPTVLEGIV